MIGAIVMTDEKRGIVLTVFTYMIWGMLPIFWKQVEHVPADELLAARIVFAFILTMLLIITLGGGKQWIADIKSLWRDKKKFFTLMLASLFISGNWFLYIYAVTNDHIVETSLGYYINPLISMLIGAVVLKEKLSPSIKVSFVLAAVGVTILTISYGSLPWLAIGMATTFAIYGYIKKTIQLNALRGLAIETLFVLPIAIGYYVYLFVDGRAAIGHTGLSTDFMLVVSGAATALPLWLFAIAAPLIPLYVVGFLQYIAPTLMLIIGVFLYGEAFGAIDLLSFSLIWAALILFTGTKVVEARKRYKDKRSALRGK